jgi:fatty-acid peroxygenase
MDLETAAVELLNLLRPTVAVGRFMVFAALAQLQHPHWAEQFRAGNEEHLRGFAQEVRRCAPFFPLVGGRASRPVDWNGHRIPTGSWVMLDIFATHRDPRLWEDPLRFRPDRHVGAAHADALIAQGAGDYADGHRCPGEPATVELIEEAIRLLTRRMRYDVPPQDLRVDLRRFPTLPRSGFVMTNVTPVEDRSLEASTSLG